LTQERWERLTNYLMENLEQIKIEDRTYAIVNSINFSFMDAFNIVCVDEFYHDIISGPYLTYQEAVIDLRSAIDRHEETRQR